MDRSRRSGAQEKRPQPPATSRLTVKARPNRRKAAPRGSFWSRLPKPAVIADACGRALRRSLPALIGMGVLGAIGGTAWAGYQFVTTSSQFAIDQIEVNGNQQLTDDQVRAMLPARIGDNVFETNLDALTVELRQNPWIASAEAHRVLPHTIVIDVREHVAAAIVQLGGLYLVDADGHPFKRAELVGDEGSGLPIITGLDRNAYVANPAGTAAQIKAAMGALATWRRVEERPAIGEVHLDVHGALTLVTYEQAISIQLGELDATLEQRMQTFDATWAELTSAERTRTRAIHLDARADQVTVAFAASDNT
jgi:cell division protein FtsQ